MYINRDFGDRFPPKLYELFFLLESMSKFKKGSYQVDVAVMQRPSVAASSLVSHIKERNTEVINHVLVYCFGLNAFYTLFVVAFNLITYHSYMILSLLWYSHREGWMREK